MVIAVNGVRVLAVVGGVVVVVVVGGVVVLVVVGGVVAGGRVLAVLWYWLSSAGCLWWSLLAVLWY